MRILVDTEAKAMHCSKPQIRPGTNSVRRVSLYGAGAKMVPSLTKGGNSSGAPRVSNMNKYAVKYKETEMFNDVPSKKLY